MNTVALAAFVLGAVMVYSWWANGGGITYIYEPAETATTTTQPGPQPATETLRGAHQVTPKQSSDEASSGESSYTGEYYDAEMATAILTQPDTWAGRSGAQINTVRWTKKTVTYHYPENSVHTPEYREVVGDAINWVAEATGINFVEAESGADVTIKAKPRGQGGHAQVAVQGGKILHAEVTIGCCDPRTAYEEIAQMLGALGDRADGRSIFSQTSTTTRPSVFDEWVIRGLYSNPAGTTPEKMAEWFRAHTPSR